MDGQELVVWSMAIGAIAAVGLARAGGLVARPSASQAQSVAFHAIVLLFVALECGVAAQFATPNPRLVVPAQVLAGPVCVALSNYWIRGWLSAAQRDRVMSAALRASALLLPLAGLACLALPAPQQLPAAAAVALAGATVTFWLATRASMLGDRLAPVMAAGCALTLPAIAGLYAVAMELRMPLALHALFALCAALCNGLTGYALWRRDQLEWQNVGADAAASRIDPVTRLASGVAVVQKLLRAQRRRRHSRRDGAVLAVMLFDVDRLTERVGAAGVNEMLVTVARRIQRQVGVVNPVGRYWDRCFISLVETIHSPAWLRTLGLRVAASVRRPVAVTTATGQQMEVQVDVGVGVVHIASAGDEVEDILHDAQRMAEAARTMASRAAILDPVSGEVVPVEQANLGPRRHGHAALVPHA